MLPKISQEMRERIMDVLMWSAIASLLLWVFAKSVGWINSPVIIEQFPVVAAAFGAGIFYQQFKDMRKELAKLNDKLDVHNSRIMKLESRN